LHHLSIEAIRRPTEGRDLVRQIFITLALIAALGVLGTSSARAGVTCKVIATLCPPEPAHDSDRDRDHGPKPVPEPGTLALLAAGAGAVGAALRRRRNKS
jgi:PEP-CTERM motif